MVPSGKYFIDGTDIGVAYGMVVESGGDSLLIFPERKEPVSHDWGDTNGIDVDLSRVFFKARDFTLNMAILGDGATDFNSKYNAFITLLAQPGPRRLSIAEFNRSYFIYYRKCSAFKRYSNLAGSGVVACKFSIDCTEIAPSINNQDLYVSDEDGRFIIS